MIMGIAGRIWPILSYYHFLYDEVLNIIIIA